MCRVVGLIVSFWLTFSSAVSGLYLLLFGEEGKGGQLIGAGFLFVIGGVWLYSTFIAADPDEQSWTSPRHLNGRSAPPM